MRQTEGLNLSFLWHVLGFILNRYRLYGLKTTYGQVLITNLATLGVRNIISTFFFLRYFIGHATSCVMTRNVVVSERGRLQPDLSDCARGTARTTPPSIRWWTRSNWRWHEPKVATIFASALVARAWSDLARLPHQTNLMEEVVTHMAP